MLATVFPVQMVVAAKLIPVSLFIANSVFADLLDALSSFYFAFVTPALAIAAFFDFVITMPGQCTVLQVFHFPQYAENVDLMCYVVAQCF